MIIGKRVELVAHWVDGRSRLAAVAETGEAAAEALAAIEGLATGSVFRAGTHDRVVDAFRRALTATRDRWPALERDIPDGALAAVLRDHPSAFVLCGHTIDLETGGLHPAYAAVRRGRKPLFAWWSPRGGFAVPPETKTEIDAGDLLGAADLLSLPCDLLQCFSTISLPDCDIGCDPGCL